jgi:hypothetical protein
VSKRDHLALIAILEALEVGDINLIGAIVLGALEDMERPEGVHCKRCGARADWPGLLDMHMCSGYFGPSAGELLRGEAA